MAAIVSPGVGLISRMIRTMAEEITPRSKINLKSFSIAAQSISMVFFVGLGLEAASIQCVGEDAS
jgi:hypothetical protein